MKYERAPEGDQPQLKTSIDDKGFHGLAIPQQIGFTDEHGTLIQMSVKRAEQLGLIGKKEVKKETRRIDKYGKELLEEWNA